MRPPAPRPFWPRAASRSDRAPRPGRAPGRRGRSPEPRWPANRSSARDPIAPGRGAGRDRAYGVSGTAGPHILCCGILVTPVPPTRPDSTADADRRSSSAGTSVFDRRYAAFAAAVLALAAFNLFFRLGAEIVSEWDESIYALTAAEMLASGDWIGTTFNGALDYYNTKPPLQVWLITLSFKVFGVGLVPLRLVSALAAWLTVGALMWWARRLAGAAVSLLSGVVLATCFAFLHEHAGRSANTDALFTLLMLLSVVAIWAADARGRWHVAWIGPIVAAAFLLRGMAILMPRAAGRHRPGVRWLGAPAGVACPAADRARGVCRARRRVDARALPARRVGVSRALVLVRLRRAQCDGARGTRARPAVLPGHPAEASLRLAARCRRGPAARPARARSRPASAATGRCGPACRCCSPPGPPSRCCCRR